MECHLTALLFASLLSIPLGVQGIHPELVPAHRNPVIARRGSNVDLVCKGSNVDKSDSEISWKFNGKKITSTNRRKLQTNEEWTTFKVSITDVSEDDVGEYQCVAAVDNYPYVKKVKAKIDFQLSALDVSTSKPNVTLDEGATATLYCDLKYPEASDVWTFWLFNGDLIETKPFHTGNAQALSHNVSSMTLELKHVTHSQSGIYTCGSNSTDLLSLQNISVRVVDAEGPKLKTVSEGFKVFKRGTNATISCEAIYPAALFVDAFWVFNASRIPRQVNSKYGESNSWYETSKGNIKRRRLDLTIYKVGFHDIGQYTCVLNTSHGLRLQNVYVNMENSTNGIKESTSSFSVSNNINKGNDHPLSTTLFIGLGLLAGLLTTAVVYFTLCRKRGPRYPEPIMSPPEEDGKDFEYDVFITYSRKDFTWVNEELLPLLNSNQIKYCVDHLHFKLGKVFLESMVEGVYKSRKVMAVWSKNYATSKYCKQELDYALQRSFDRSDSAVIVIRIDPTDKKQLPKALRARTFLDYADRVEREGWEKRLIKHLKPPRAKKTQMIGTLV